MRRPIRLPVLLLLAAAVGLAAVGCAKRQEPVGRLSASAGEIELGYPGVAQFDLNWEMQAPLDGLEGSPVVFLHLLDGQGNIIRTFDHEFPAAWNAGGEHSYSVPIYQSALAPPLDVGSYPLTAGLYDRTGRRWPLETAGRAVADGEYEVATVVIGESGGAMPQFFFSSAWLSVEGGTDLQVLARRWLTEDGVIRLGGLAAPGKLWLRIGIPQGGGALQEPVIADGETTQQVTVTTTCGDAAVQVSGAGSHSITLPIALPQPGEEGAAVATGECEIGFDANFHMLSQDGNERRTMVLEGLFWEQSG